MDPQQYLKSLWEKLQQQYRNIHAGGSAVGANNPFNNPYFQSLTNGTLTEKGLPANAPTSPQYNNDLGGVLKGLLDRMQAQAQPAVNTAKQGVQDAYHKLFQ